MRLSAGTPSLEEAESESESENTAAATVHFLLSLSPLSTSGRSLKVRRLPWEQEQAGALPVVPTTFLPYQRMHGVCSLPVKQRELGATPSAGATFPISNGACDVTAAFLPVKEAVRGRNPSGTPLSKTSLNAKQFERPVFQAGPSGCESHQRCHFIPALIFHE